MKLIIVIPYSAGDCVMAERLCDHIYRLNGYKSVGSVLLVANDDVHEEMRIKVGIAAEMAFESVTATIAPKLDAEFAANKFRQMNNLFRHAAATVQQSFRWPWFWLEPDAVPVIPGWMGILSGIYDSQPKKYVGLVTNPGTSAPGFMARCGIYFQAASYELDRLITSDVPFAIATSEEVLKRATNTDIVQYLNILTVDDLRKISPNTVVIHGDKMGIFAENYFEVSEPDTTPEPVPVRVTRRQVRDAEYAKKENP